MKMGKLIRILKHNPKYPFKLFVGTNAFILMFFMLMTSKNTTHISDVEGESKTFKFSNFNVSSWNESQNYSLPNLEAEFFVSIGVNQLCYKLGTDLAQSNDTCVCKPRYYGDHCGIPESAWKSYYRYQREAVANLKPRKHPRRLIHGLQVNHEIDMFEARLKMLGDAVDVYLLLESNYTSYGSSKPLTFLHKFQDGWLSEFQEKILYILLPFFPKQGETNGWFADSFLRLYLGKHGMPLVSNLRDDDVFLLLDADELPTKESLMFLKSFDGWTEPVQFGFRWTNFGFYWLVTKEDDGVMSKVISKLFNKKKAERLLTLTVACTVGMMRKVYRNNAWALRKNLYKEDMMKDLVANYTVDHPAPKEWLMGGIHHYAGWHCSWCYQPEGIKLKLTSAQKHDKPRWGDYPEKLDLDYIAGLIETGGWFDGSHKFIKVDRRETSDHLYAPPYFIENEDKFEYLLIPPSDRL